MATFSTYNIKIDNNLAFTAGPTAGYILAINTNGSTYWTSIAGPTGPQGVQGVQGVTGTNGTNGSNGATGPAGTNGIDGATGPAGSGTTQSFVTITDTGSGTITWVYNINANAKVTVTGSRALSITGASSGDTGNIIITQGPAGGYYTTLPSPKTAGGTYSFSLVGTQSDIYSFLFDGTSYYWNYNKSFS